MIYYFIFSIILCITQLFAEEKKLQIKTTIIEKGSIKLDGVLDESAWYTVEPATGFKQRDPNEGEPCTEKTEVYVIYDEDNLYIGAKLFDSNPSGILAPHKKRDAPLRGDDRFMFILDTFHDYRTGYFFEINPAGLMGDGIIGVGGRFNVNKSWDGIWDTRVIIDKDGWSAEIVIPFQTLAFDPNNDTWGINFQRTIRRKNEDAKWTGYKRGIWLTKPVHAGELTGLKGIKPGKGLELKPYYVFKDQYSIDENLGNQNNIGFDFSFNVKSGVKGSFTYNTDFAEAEVDDRKVNLTRFPLKLEEKRSFFLEGSSVYSFANSNGVIPFFSRRIGISEGNKIPISYGGRINGQVGNYEMGLMNLNTDKSENIPAENFQIARVKKSIFKQSYIGMIYTDRSAKTDSIYQDQNLFGIDFDYTTASFRGDKNFQFQTFFVGHNSNSTLNETFSDLSSRGVRISYPNDLWYAHASYRELGDSFDPALGFIPRNGFKRFQPTIKYKPRPESLKLVRQLEFGAELEYMTNNAGNLIKQEMKYHLLKIKFENGDEASAGTIMLKEYLDEDFEIVEGNVITTGNYESNGFYINTKTSNSRKIGAEIKLYQGEFWTGDIKKIETKLFFNPIPGLNLSGDLNYNNIGLSSGNFETTLYKLIVGIYPTPKLAFYNNIQYDDISNILGLYSKLRYTIRPGSDLYLVYSNNWQNFGQGMWGNDYTTISRESSVKINYTHRF